METPQTGTVELPWVPCSPPALGRELSLALLSGKAGRTPQHTGLGASGAVRKEDSTNGGHNHYLNPPMHPPAHPTHSSCTQPGAQAREAGAHRAAACSAGPASPHPLPFELEPPSPHLRILTWLQAHLRTASQRWAAQAGLDWAEVCNGILRLPSQTHGDWGRESSGSPCPPWVMNELTIGY